jgi:hypothetical protein
MSRDDGTDDKEYTEDHTDHDYNISSMEDMMEHYIDSDSSCMDIVDHCTAYDPMSMDMVEHHTDYVYDSTSLVDMEDYTDDVEYDMVVRDIDYAY